MNKRIVSLLLVFVLLSLVAITPAASVQASTPVAAQGTQDVMRFLTINVLVQHCTVVFTGFPPVLNPSGCTPLNNAYWQYRWNNSNYVPGPATNVNGVASLNFPVPIGVGGTIRCLGYQMEHIVNYTATQSSVQCKLYSLRT